MRDEKRVERILHKIGLIWMKNSQLRLYQLLINYAGLEDTFKAWNMEDDDIEKYLDETIKEVYKGKK